MSDKMPSLSGGHELQKTIALNTKADIKSMEKRVLSSTEHLNEILSLNALVIVKTSLDMKLTGREAKLRPS